MNRLTLLLVASGLSVTLLAGCTKRERRLSLEERKAQRTNTVVAVKPSPPPPQPVKAPPQPVKAPGSINYLDFKNGFRDVVFGQQESSIGDLVLKTQDEQRQVKTFTRSGELLLLFGVPLKSIEYSFFKGQLYLVSIKWRIEQKDDAQTPSPVVTLAPFCASLYGPPSFRTIEKDPVELKWSGQQVELTMSESVVHGVRDLLKGGWAIPPVASGQMVLEKTDFRKAFTAMLASVAESRKDGL